MNIVRRDFLRVGAAGMTGAILGIESAYGQGEKKAEGADADSVIEFRGGTGSLRFELQLEKANPPGTLALQLENFRQGSFKPGFERSLIMSGSYRPTGGSPVKIYRSYFSVDDDYVFARLVDGLHSTNFSFSPSGKQNITFVTVWNDTNEPETLHVDRSKFTNNRGQRPEDYIVGHQPQDVDILRGFRKPPDISVEQLERSLDNDPDYLAFVRGKKYGAQHAAIFTFACVFLVVAVPGGTLYALDWEN